MRPAFREHGAAVDIRSSYAGIDGNPRSAFVVLALIVMLIGTWALIRTALG